MKILVTGGAGYIGSFMTRLLLDGGNEVIVVDNLGRGHRELIDLRAKLKVLDLKDKKSTNKFFEEEKVDALMHFAGLISVEESNKNPDLYWENNVLGSYNLFESAVGIGKVKKIIFSSTAAIYGNPIKVPIPEDHPKNPTSVYGQTKLEVEQNLDKLSKNDPSVSFASLRYFNASGAALDGSLGEMHDPETHIIPLAIEAVTGDKDFSLFGTDYKTTDGTCVRDYIHVLDLAWAHLLALKKIDEEKGGFYYNVGTGNGYSNREVLSMVQKIANKEIKIVERERRVGDASVLVADPTKIKQELRFSPKYSDLETIVKTAWMWHTKNLKS